MRIITAAMFSAYLCLAAAAGDDWAIEKPMNTILDKPLTGKIFGRDFVLGSAEINNNALTFKSHGHKEGWPESQLIIFVGTKADKKEWIVTPDADGHPPHVHMKFAKTGKNLPGTLMFTGEYSMKLVFTEVTSTQVKGKLHISLPDYQKSYLVGSFTADVK